VRIGAAVLFTVGGGQALLAFILERKRAVGIVKNPKHKEFVKKNLMQAVKTLGLAPDRRPAKPAYLVAWEQSRNVGGNPPAIGAASSSLSYAAGTHRALRRGHNQLAAERAAGSPRRGHDGRAACPG